MAKLEEYVSRTDEMGSIHISQEVLAAIAGAAAMEIDGVTGLSAPLSDQLLSSKKNTKGVHIQIEEDRVTVDISVIIRYGSVIPDVAKKVQDSVMSALEGTSGLTVAAVNVRVGGISFAKE